MIRFKLGDYEVEISAYSSVLREHDKDTLYLLNQLCIMSGIAAGASRDHGCEGIAAEYREIQMDLYKACLDNGLYREVKQYDIR